MQTWCRASLTALTTVQKWIRASLAYIKTLANSLLMAEVTNHYQHGKAHQITLT
jgi:hypothetical protein